MWIPFFGWYAWKADMIPVDRSKGSQALADMNAGVRRELARDRQIVIFPEGTRRAPGAEPKY
jgi:1-acyl-sn-glycerol-3-phosphate acyltransferase